MDWAKERAAQKNASNRLAGEAYVVGAVIDPGFCLDFLTTNGIQAIEKAYDYFCSVVTTSGGEIPQNRGGRDHLRRKLDYAVINLLHCEREETEDIAFDSVRGVFMEGDRVYQGSGFRRKTHIQICVRNPDSIKGVFRVPERHFSQA